MAPQRRKANVSLCLADGGPKEWIARLRGRKRRSKRPKILADRLFRSSDPIPVPHNRPNPLKNPDFSGWHYVIIRLARNYEDFVKKEPCTVLPLTETGSV